jgi:hypothetical protein
MFLRRFAFLSMGSLMVLVLGSGLGACGGRYSASNNNVNDNGNNVSVDCGDGIIDSGEQCDGSALAGQTCEGLGFVGGGLACGADCWHDVSGCEIPQGCGDGVLDPGEACDGVNLGGQDCAGLGFEGGPLGCTLACRFDTAGCQSTGVCGDDMANPPGEACDGSDLAGQTCQSLGYDGGALVCNGACQLDVEGCTSVAICGDGQLEAGEQCDDTVFGGATCVSLGFDGGTLVCDAACSFDTSGCTLEGCGDGVIELGEECDGTHFGGVTCQSLGFAGGLLLCTGTCRLDTSSCADPCGNSAIDAGEECDGANLAGETCQGLGFIGGDLDCTPTCDFDTSDCIAGGAENCTNGVDDDGNGQCDCLDAACSTEIPCLMGGPETTCDDGVDNDHDCLVDCDDSDCLGSPTCAALTCTPFQNVGCGSSVNGTTVGGPLSFEVYPNTCAADPNSGPEAYFLLANAGSIIPMHVTVNLNATSNQDLDLIVVGVSGTDCDVQGACITSSQNAGGAETALFTAQLGQSYYIIVDGFDGAADSFSMTVSCQ